MQDLYLQQLNSILKREQKYPLQWAATTTLHEEVVIKWSLYLLVTVVCGSNDNCLHFLLKQNLLLAAVTAYSWTTERHLANIPTLRELHFSPQSFTMYVPFKMNLRHSECFPIKRYGCTATTITTKAQKQWFPLQLQCQKLPNPLCSRNCLKYTQKHKTRGE